MDLDAVVRQLCDRLPEAIGAVLCDFDGEAVVSAVGHAPAPQGAEVLARARIPRALASEVSLTDFLMRVSGAEPSAFLRAFDEQTRTRGLGPLEAVDLRFDEVDVLVRRLPEDYYVMLALRRPSRPSAARQEIEEARRSLAALIA